MGNNPVKKHDRVIQFVKLFLHSIVHLIVNKYFMFQSDSFVGLHVIDLNQNSDLKGAYIWQNVVESYGTCFFFHDNYKTTISSFKSLPWMVTKKKWILTKT